MPVDNSRLKGFYKLDVEERRQRIAELAGLTEEQVADIEKLLEKIEEDDDVQNVYHTMKE